MSEKNSLDSSDLLKLIKEYNRMALEPKKKMYENKSSETVW